MHKLFLTADRRCTRHGSYSTIVHSFNVRLAQWNDPADRWSDSHFERNVCHDVTTYKGEIIMKQCYCSFEIDRSLRRFLFIRKLLRRTKLYNVAYQEKTATR